MKFIDWDNCVRAYKRMFLFLQGVHLCISRWNPTFNKHFYNLQTIQQNIDYRRDGENMGRH